MDKTPPCDVNAEEQVLGAMLIDPDILVDVMTILKPSDFYRDKNRDIFEACVKLNNAGTIVNQATVAHATKMEIDALNQLVERIITTVQIADLANIVKDCAIRRQMVQSGSEIVKLAYDETEPLKNVLAKATAAMDAVQNEAPQEGLTSLRKIAGDFYDNLEEPIEGNFEPPKGLMTGFHDLDRILGGFRQGNLIILAARPAIGKTSLALNIAHKVGNKGATVAIFSLEMTKDELMQKMLGNETKIDISKMRNNWLTQQERHEVVYGLSKLSDLPVWVDDDPTISLPVIRNRAARLQSHEGLDLVIVDHLGLVAITDKRGNREQEVAALSKGFKVLAKTLNVPVLLITQLNRAVEARSDKRPILSDLRDSGCLSVQGTLCFDNGGVRVYTTTQRQTYTLNKGGEVMPVLSKNVPTGIKPMVRIKCESGRFIDCTPDHKILTDRGWTPASLLTNKYSIAAVRKIASPHNTRTIPHAKWIGWMLGNGSMLEQRSPSFICSDKDVADAFVRTTEALFGRTPKPHPHWSAKVWQYDITYGPVRTPAGNPCKDWLIDHGLWGMRSYQKAIPEWLLAEADDGSIAALLSGLIETDGCVTGQQIKYATTSRIMAWQVVWCFNRLGIFAYIDDGWLSDKANYPCYTVAVNGGPDVALCQKLLPIIGVKGKRLFAIVPGRGSNKVDRIGTWIHQEITIERHNANLSHSQLGYRSQGKRISQADLKRVFAKLPSLKKTYGHLVNPNICWDKLESWKEIEPGEVFDRTVINGEPNFVANGLIVHNSQEQDADIVMLISRDEKTFTQEQWDRQFPNKKYPVGEAIIDIAKNRSGPTGSFALTFLKETTTFENLTRQ